MDFPNIHSRYKIIKTLGEGGMGLVYLAEDKANSNRLTAIKTIKARLLKKPESLKQFKQEYYIMSKLWHPNLARVYDFGEINEGHYLTMEYIKGRELKSIVKEKGKLDLEEALPIMVDLLRAMEFVHSRNIIYSDVKPQNILITEDNQIKLIDFGVSDFTREVTKTVRGTISYMPPEVINGTPKDHRADIFSLGVLFYEILTGNVLYEDISINSVFNSLSSSAGYNIVLQESLVKLGHSPLKELIAKMCAYFARDRFFSCSEIISNINTRLNRRFLLETEETKEAFVVGIPFTGRERELKFLENSVNSKENQLFCILGDQGIGKSKLLKEFENWCNLNGLFYIVGNSAKGESYEPFMTIVYKILFNYETQVPERQKMYLKKLIPDHPALSNVTVQKNEIIDAKTLKDVLVDTISSIIVNFAVKSGKTIVLVFENLENTDELSLETINEILFKIKRNNIMNLKLFAECRREKQSNIAAFFTKLKERNRLKVLELNDFTEAEVKQYIENSFGKKFIDKTLFKKIKIIYEFCGGNPLFLQELIKSMVNDNLIQKDRLYWQFSGPFSNIKLGNNLLDVISKKIKDLQLPNDYYKAMVFMSFSANEKFYVDFYLQYAANEFNVHWQKLFDYLVRKELLQVLNDYYITPNKLYKKAIHSILSSEEIVHQHETWVKILEKQLPQTFNIDGLPDNLLFDLSYHYYNCGFTNLEAFLARTGRFLLESGNREKAKYSNKKAIFYYSKLIKEINKFTGMQIKNIKAILKIKLQAVRGLSKAYETAGKWDKAQNYFEQSISIAKELQDETLIGECKCDLGRLILNKGRYDYAITLFNEAKAIALKGNNKKLYSTVIGNIGIVLYCLGDCSKAMECYEEQRLICLESGDKQGYSSAVGNMGIVYYVQGDYVKAMEYYNEKKQICSELKDKRGISVAIGNIGLLYYMQGNYSKAMEYFEEDKQICLELGDNRGYSITVSNIGLVYYDQGDYFKALQCYEEHKQICLELDDKLSYSIVVVNLGILFAEQGDYVKAMQCYEESINIAKELKIKFHLCSYLVSKAKLNYILKEFSDAEATIQEAQRVAGEIERKDVIFDCSILSYKLLALDNPEEAVTHLTNALKNAQDLESQALIHYEIHRINQSEKNRQKALELYQALYQKTPRYSYKMKIAELSQKTTE